MGWSGKVSLWCHLQPMMRRSQTMSATYIHIAEDEEYLVISEYADQRLKK